MVKDTAKELDLKLASLPGPHHFIVCVMQVDKRWTQLNCTYVCMESLPRHSDRGKYTRSYSITKTIGCSSHKSQGKLEN